MIKAIREGGKPNAPIEDANISVTILQLSNLAWKYGCTLDPDRKTGRIRNHEQAMQMWSREYPPGWALKI